MPNGPLRLTYFGFRGLGEPIRLMLEDLGVDYEDHRVSDAEWADLKPKLPFRQMPRLEDGDVTLVQSQAILRHLARPRGLYGETKPSASAAISAPKARATCSNDFGNHFWSPGSDQAEAIAAFEQGTLAHQLDLTAARPALRPSRRAAVRRLLRPHCIGRGRGVLPERGRAGEIIGGLSSPDVRAARVAGLCRLGTPAHGLRLRPHPGHSRAKGRLAATPQGRGSARAPFARPLGRRPGRERSRARQWPRRDRRRR